MSKMTGKRPPQVARPFDTTPWRLAPAPPPPWRLLPLPLLPRPGNVLVLLTCRAPPSRNEPSPSWASSGTNPPSHCRANPRPRAASCSRHSSSPRRRLPQPPPSPLPDLWTRKSAPSWRTRPRSPPWVWTPWLPPFRPTLPRRTFPPLPRPRRRSRLWRSQGPSRWSARRLYWKGSPRRPLCGFPLALPHPPRSATRPLRLRRPGAPLFLPVAAGARRAVQEAGPLPGCALAGVLPGPAAGAIPSR